MRWIVFITILLSMGFSITSVDSQKTPILSIDEELEKSKTVDKNKATLLIYSETDWMGKIQDGDYTVHEIQSTGNDRFLVNCGKTNTSNFISNLEYLNGELDSNIAKICT